MNESKKHMNATIKKMIGTALLWVAFATLVYFASSDGGSQRSIVAGLGFISFALGLALFTNGLKYDIIAQVQQKQRDDAG